MRSLAFSIGLLAGAGVSYYYYIRKQNQDRSPPPTNKPLSEDALLDLKNQMNSRSAEDSASGLIRFCEASAHRQVKVTTHLRCCERGVVRLECKHSYCLCKLRALLVSSLNLSLPIKQFKCYCLAPIPIEIAQVALTMTPAASPEVASKLASKLGRQAAGLFTCGVCGEALLVDGGVTLDCNHRFCKACLADYLGAEINEAKVRRLVCPGYKCGAEISESILTAQLSREALSKLEAFRLNQLEGSGLEVRMSCVPCKKFWLFDPQGELEADCPSCGGKVLVERKEEDLQIEGVKRCPKCKEAVVKEGGCNFMRCSWVNCGALFCFLCLKQLTHEDHYSHFVSGPYNDECHGC
jgi:DNA-directed RNA polymerase subunit RPC12/RpoP